MNRGWDYTFYKWCDLVFNFWYNSGHNCSLTAGEYFKFNSNTGHAEPDTATMQALSHFTYHQSKHGLRRLYLEDPTWVFYLMFKALVG